MTCSFICSECDDGEIMPVFHCPFCTKPLCSECLPRNNHECSDPGGWVTWYGSPLTKAQLEPILRYAWEYLSIRSRQEGLGLHDN